VLLAVEHVRDRRRHDPLADVRLPQLLAVARAVGDEAPGMRPLEDEIAGRRQRAAARVALVRHPPARALLDGVPREQEARRTDGLAGARLVLGSGQRSEEHTSEL